MKELSIQEKATRYDEAIERAESIYNETAIPSATTKGICTYIFPELKESEDERISGNIIATIHLYYGEPLEDEAKEMIAWLEKQGEQKIKTPEESLGIDSDTYNKIVDECIYGEQKPAALSEEDVKALNRISTILVDASEVKNWWKEYRLIERDEMIRLNDFLKSLIDRYTWKPSEEQMKSLKDALNDAIFQYNFKGSMIKEEVTRKHAETIESLYNDLKKL